MTVTGLIFTLEIVRTPKGNVFRLRINFTPEVIMLTKEVKRKRAAPMCDEKIERFFLRLDLGSKFEMARISSSITIGEQGASSESIVSVCHRPHGEHSCLRIIELKSKNSEC